jgi:dTDP-D-glucose 4,6-dehydratase
MSEKYLEIVEIIMAARADAVGVAFRELDCGCARLCGVSRKGDPVGEVYNYSGQPTTRNLEPLVCLKCYRDKRFAQERTARQGILWTDVPDRRTEEDERHTIGRVVFGDDYRD